MFCYDLVLIKTHSREVPGVPGRSLGGTGIPRISRKSLMGCGFDASCG